MARELGRVLVTGANGHLGRLLISRFPELGPCRLRAVVRSSRAAEQLEALPPSLRPEVRVLDYGKIDELAGAAEGCQSAVHLVGIIKETRSASYAAAHEQSCAALARAAEKAGIERIVYLSILGSEPSSANACLASKGRAERVLLDGPVSTTILRVPMVLGPDDYASHSLRAQAQAGWVPLIDAGKSWHQPIDAEDVVRAVAAALRREELDRKAVDLAGPEALRQRELVERAAALYGSKPRFIPVPMALARLLARGAESLLADPPMTIAMLEVLQRDDRIDSKPAFAQLGIEATALDEVLRRYVGPSSPQK